MKTARPHVITISLSLGAIVVSLFSLQQSCTAQRVSKATSRAMLIFKSAEWKGLRIPETTATQRQSSLRFLLAFQVENVGKAVAHNPSLQYNVALEPIQGKIVNRSGTIKFTDDLPGIPVTAAAIVEVPYASTERKIVKVEKIITPLTLTVHYKLSYDDEATDTHFDEEESCVMGIFSSLGETVLQPCLPFDF